MSPRAASLLVLLAVAACASTAKRETASLAEAVERWQRADVPQKAAATADVRAVGATDAEVAAARTACLGAMDATVRALDLKQQVERGLADLEAKRITPDDPAAAALPGKLDESERLLKEGRRAMTDCEQKVMSLRMKYGV